MFIDVHAHLGQGCLPLVVILVNGAKEFRILGVGKHKGVRERVGVALYFFFGKVEYAYSVDAVCAHERVFGVSVVEEHPKARAVLHVERAVYLESDVGLACGPAVDAALGKGPYFRAGRHAEVSAHLYIICFAGFQQVVKAEIFADGNVVHRVELQVDASCGFYASGNLDGASEPSQYR